MKKLLYSCFICLTLISCHSLVEDEFHDTLEVPVINACLEQGKPFQVHITISANLTDSFPLPVKNANVIIETQNSKPDTLKYSKNGWYFSSHIVQMGETYVCKISIPGYPLISSQTTVPDSTKIESVLFTDLAERGEEGEKISSIEFEINNNPNKKQFWHVLLISEGLITDYENGNIVQKYGIENETIYMVSGQDITLLNEANPLTLFSNKLIYKNNYKVKFYINEGYTHFYRDRTYYIELRSVDEAYYKHLKQYYIYESASLTEIGITPQKYPLFSNITNGLGIFYSYSYVRKKLLLK